MKLLGQRANGLLKMCNLIRMHPQGHKSVRGRKTHVLKNVVKITIAKTQTHSPMDRAWDGDPSKWDQRDGEGESSG